MALRDQPYLPLYVQDFLTDEKLILCSAEATGVYIRLLCIMHKSSEYGTFLLRQNDWQNGSTCQNFAKKLSKFMPYDEDTICRALNELIAEEVLAVDGSKLMQKRMVHDNNISVVRSEAGSKGGFAKAKKLAKDIAKDVANTENENEYENEIENDNKETLKEQKLKLLEKRKLLFRSRVAEFRGKYSDEMLGKFFNYWTEMNKSGSQMRWEMEKTWELEKRLSNWASRDNSFVRVQEQITYKELVRRFNEGETDIWERYEPAIVGDKRSLWRIKKSGTEK